MQTPIIAAATVLAILCVQTPASASAEATAYQYDRGLDVQRANAPQKAYALDQARSTRDGDSRRYAAAEQTGVDNGAAQHGT